MPTTLERCPDHHAGLWIEKRGSHQNVLGNDQLGRRILFQPSWQNARSSSACTVERARDHTSQDNSAWTVGRTRRLGVSFEEVSYRTHRTERTRARVQKGRSQT